MTFQWIIMWKWLEAALGWGEWVHNVKGPGEYFSVESLTSAFLDYQTSAVSSDFHNFAESPITKYYMLRGQCGKIITLLEIPFWVSLTFFHWKIKLFTILILEEIFHCLVNNYQYINFGVNLVLSCQNSNSLIETRVSLAASGIGHITMTMILTIYDYQYEYQYGYHWYYQSESRSRGRRHIHSDSNNDRLILILIVILVI